MHSPKILVYSPKNADQYASLLRDHGYSSIVVATNPAHAAEALPETEIIFCWKFPTHLLSHPSASSVRWIQSMGAGVEDLMADSSIPQTVMVTRIVDQFGGPIAEYVFAVLLYQVKGIFRMVSSQSGGLWDYFEPTNLAGKRIGVAGLGSIGAEIVRKARAFDMRVDGLSYSGKNAGLVDWHYDPADWKKFVEELDVLVLTLPLTNGTYHVMNQELLRAMRSDAILVNVGRGKLIDQEALIHVLESGHLQAAILDVFEEEPLASGHPLWSLPNVFISPHLSGPSTPQGVGLYFLQNLQQYLSGRTLHGLVSRARGY
jgi:glyoxylate/hydroxypyruvate reductase